MSQRTVSFVPRTDRTGSLGTVIKKWGHIHAHSGSFQYLKVHKNAVVSGSLTFGDSVGNDTIAFSAEVSSSILPNQSNLYDLGSTSKKWKDLHLSGKVTSSAVTTDIFTGRELKLDWAPWRNDNFIKGIRESNEYDLHISASQNDLKLYAGDDVSINFGDSNGKLKIDNHIELRGNLGDTMISAPTNGIIISSSTNDVEIGAGDDVILTATDDVKINPDDKLFIGSEQGVQKVEIDCTRSEGEFELDAKDIRLDTEDKFRIRVGSKDYVTISDDYNFEILRLFDYNPGTNSYHYNKLDVSGSVNILGGLDVAGTITASNIVLTGDTTIGNYSNDSVSFNADISSSLIPDIPNKYSLGSMGGKYWKDLYIKNIWGQPNGTFDFGSGSVFIGGGTVANSYLGNPQNPNLQLYVGEIRISNNNIVANDNLSLSSGGSSYDEIDFHSNWYNIHGQTSYDDSQFKFRPELSSGNNYQIGFQTVYNRAGFKVRFGEEGVLKLASQVSKMYWEDGSYGSQWPGMEYTNGKLFIGRHQRGEYNAYTLNISSSIPTINLDSSISQSYIKLNGDNQIGFVPSYDGRIVKVYKTLGVNHISASGVVSSSGFYLKAGSIRFPDGSTQTTAATSSAGDWKLLSGTQTSSKHVLVEGSISASLNISASGNIFANDMYVGDDLFVGYGKSNSTVIRVGDQNNNFAPLVKFYGGMGNDNQGLEFISGSNTTVGSISYKIGKTSHLRSIDMTVENTGSFSLYNDKLVIKGDISASGDLHIEGNDIYGFGQTKRLTLGSTNIFHSALSASGDITAQDIYSRGGQIYASTHGSSGNPTEKIRFNSNNIRLYNPLTTVGSITASNGAISSSGFVTTTKVNGGAWFDKNIFLSQTGSSFYSGYNASKIIWGGYGDGNEIHMSPSKDDLMQFKAGGATLLQLRGTDNEDRVIIGNSTPTDAGERMYVGGSLKVGGAVTSSGAISASGTITAEHLLSTDDAVISDDLTVGGDINTSGYISSSGYIYTSASITASRGMFTNLPTSDTGLSAGQMYTRTGTQLGIASGAATSSKFVLIK